MDSPNKVITTHVIYRSQQIPVEQLKSNSNIKVLVECPHGQRMVKWCRRHQLCYSCNVELGVYNTSKKGRDITWGDKISKAKKGKKFSDEHKKALVDVRLQKLADRNNTSIEDTEFSTKGVGFKLRCFAMTAIKKSLIRYSASQQDQLILEGLNYTIQQLKTHLELKFKPGMSWDNYGKEWHIDHVKPVSWFSYSSTADSEFKVCWSLENLQPLWKTENLSKSNLYEGPYKQPYFYLLYGQSGVGKTTLLQDFADKFNIIEADKVPYKEIDKLIANNWYRDKPVILCLSVHISTTIRRYLSKYDVKTIAVLESTEVVKQRIESRSGRIKNIEQRHKRIQAIVSEFSSFVGSLDEVRNYLSSLK